MSAAIEVASHGAMREAVIILGAAAVVIPLFHRIKVSPILGFMLVGLLVGPFGLGALAGRWPVLAWVTIADQESIAPVAELGVVLLLFVIGLELSFERILIMRRLVFGFGSLQVLLSMAAIAGVAMLTGAAPKQAVVVGLALAMSSTAVVAQVLAQEKRMTSLVGRASFAVLLFQDLAVVPVMFGLNLLGGDEAQGPMALGLVVGQALGAIVGLVVLGRLVLRPLFRGVARTNSPELFMAACLLVVLATGMAAEMAGLSMALGALIAGLLLAETEYRRQIEVTVEPFKGLLLGVFLISVGMNLDIGAVVAHPVAVIGAALGLVAVKAAIIVGVGRGFRLLLPVAGPAGLLLGAGGEFGFIILGLGRGLGVLDAEAASFAYIVAALTMAAIPLLSVLGVSAFPVRAVPIDATLLPPDGGHDAPEVIIAGFGRVGQTVAALLETHGLGYLALDTDVRRVARGRRDGRMVYYGDVSQAALLEHVGLASARALVVTVDDRAMADGIVRLARAARPDLLIIARARDAPHAAQLYALGASDAVPETIEASLLLAEAVLVDLGVPMGPVLVSIHEKRAEFQAEIKARAPDMAVRQRGRRRLGGS